MGRLGDGYRRSAKLFCEWEHFLPANAPFKTHAIFCPRIHAMFARPRGTGLVAPPKKKRKVAPAIEEISFDPSAREDYLTGFHKRKVQRIKNAREEAAKRDREEKLAARKTVCFISAPQ
jgi:hypothetical protein